MHLGLCIDLTRTIEAITKATKKKSLAIGTGRTEQENWLIRYLKS